MTDRIATILAMLRDNPDDVFLHYSLAMEYAGSGDDQKAVQQFTECMRLRLPPGNCSPAPCNWPRLKARRTRATRFVSCWRLWGKAPKAPATLRYYPFT